MNMKIALINRALYSAGLLNSHGADFSRISRDDRNNPDRKYSFDVCRSYYLSTYLEILSEVPWTSGRRRKRLLKRRRPYGNTGYNFTYGLPRDCARPVELSGKAYYIIEGSYLCTNEDKAELLYVSNGRVFSGNINVTAAPDVGEDANFTSYPGGVDEDDIIPDEVINPGDIEELENEDDKNNPRADDDYPDYKALDMEPKFWELLEMSLAAKFAIKNTQQPRLHDTLMQKALLIKNDAIKSTKSIVTAKKESNPWWADTLGLPKSHDY